MDAQEKANAKEAEKAVRLFATITGLTGLIAIGLAVMGIAERLTTLVAVLSVTGSVVTWFIWLLMMIGRIDSVAARTMLVLITLAVGLPIVILCLIVAGLTWNGMGGA